MQIHVEGVDRLRLADGSPVRAASAVTPFGDGFLVAQDDATHGAWFRSRPADAVRLLPAVDGLDVFENASGTKHLKPDLEAACAVDVDGAPAVLLLGSGSLAARMRWSLLRLVAGRPEALVTDMAPLYAAVADALAIPPEVLNLEGACLVGDVLRWYHRGIPAAGVPAGSVDLEPAAAVAAALGRTPPGSVAVSNPRHYTLGEVDGVGLGITDAVALADGTVLLSAAAEDSPNPRDDGPVVGSALVRLDDHLVRDMTPLPLVDGRVCKVEGLMVLDADPVSTRLLAVVDVDEPDVPSLAMRLRVRH
ncbi:DUF6910 family protein [Nocardioides bizhenqiangii]|uniref:DUF917 family protein n=1 Tax=Nocardioides bizhenqiangii TaxID=3095076 RepID=A0ABZ0ZQE8_9ACTN|nr:MULTISPECIES: hypothetical protein [unclassified Nocardioides]MDZ5619516.1 hypothetical protein [Nocardioides sp. HM23]WQQ26467.1 hypothetical protein SHK19_21240 [Nocardioides sp. HM61]